MKTMRKRTLTDRAAKASRKTNVKLTQEQTLQAVSLFFRELFQAIASGETDHVELRGLCTLDAAVRKARDYTLPSGEKVHIGKRGRVKLRLSPEWQGRFDRRIRGLSA